MSREWVTWDGDVIELAWPGDLVVIRPGVWFRNTAQKLTTTLFTPCNAKMISVVLAILDTDFLTAHSYQRHRKAAYVDDTGFRTEHTALLLSGDTFMYIDEFLISRIVSSPW